MNQNVKPWDRILSPLMALGISYPLFLVAGLDQRFGWSPEFPLHVNIAGLVLIVSGYTFVGWAMITNRFFSAFVRIQSDRGHAVCDSGPYRIMRHPGYAGSIWPLAGIVMALDSLWTVIPATAAFIIIVVRTLLEDNALKKELPGYADYAQRVRFRLLPGIF